MHIYLKIRTTGNECVLSRTKTTMKLQKSRYFHDTPKKSRLKKSDKVSRSLESSKLQAWQKDLESVKQKTHLITPAPRRVTM